MSKPSGEVQKIIVGLHGFGDSSRRFAYYTGLHNAVDNHTLVVYPDALMPTEKGLKKGWNASFCCGSGWVTKTDDAGFIVALVEQLKQQYGNESTKVFVTGFSNGAFMTQRLATDYPHIISAIATSSGSIGTTETKLTPEKPVPILLLHGEKDTIVPFNGGVGSSDPDFQWISFEETVRTWQRVNEDNAEARQITYENDRHQWHDWRLFNIWHKKPHASQEVTAFFNDIQ